MTSTEHEEILTFNFIRLVAYFIIWMVAIAMVKCESEDWRNAVYPHSKKEPRRVSTTRPVGLPMPTTPTPLAPEATVP